jgi:hypothetical protein
MRPPFELTAEKKAAFEQVYRSSPEGESIEYALPFPKWQFLSYLCMQRALVLHGSQKTDITVVEPRQANDLKEFSNRSAIYATTDGIWVIFFAILDRGKYPAMSLFNSCVQARAPNGLLGEPMYFFSISHPALLQKPWTTGAMYILPRQSFQQEPAQQVQRMEIVSPHWISAQPARPVAKLMVGSVDFPFLDQIHGHNNERLVQRFAVDPDGFPWLDALES